MENEPSDFYKKIIANDNDKIFFKTFEVFDDCETSDKPSTYEVLSGVMFVFMDEEDNDGF